MSHTLYSNWNPQRELEDSLIDVNYLFQSLVTDILSGKDFTFHKSNNHFSFVLTSFRASLCNRNLVDARFSSQNPKGFLLEPNDQVLKVPTA